MPSLCYRVAGYGPCLAATLHLFKAKVRRRACMHGALCHATLNHASAGSRPREHSR